MIHRVIADYGPNVHRFMKRYQVMATKIFDADFRQQASLEPVLA